MRLDWWTFALQTINVVVLVWLLARFLFRPVAGIIAARRAAADALIAEAEATRAKSASEAAALARQRDELAGDGARMAAAARASADAERAALLHQANADALKLRTDAEQAIEHERQAMRDALEHEAEDLAVTIAQRLLERLPVQALQRAFLDGLAEAIATHPARASLASAPLELRSAVPMDGAMQDECRNRLARALAGVPELSFRTDPKLIAGFELASRHAVIRNSWRGDLEHISNALREVHDVAIQHVA